MFKHLLLATDGSPSSAFATEQCISMALATGARITALHVLPAFHWISLTTENFADSQDQFLANARRQAGEILDKVAEAARRAGVPCETVVQEDAHVDEAIVAVARARQCDLIVMASHGRKGLRSLLLGSETHKVLTHAPLPVLVLRPPAPAAGK